MRKLNKKIIYAKVYKNWLESTKNFPKYYSNHKFKNDILAELLICQKGLCAYSEYSFELSDNDIKKIKEQFDSEGKLIGKLPDVSADLDHFDASIKKTNPYEWSNFFAVWSPLNTRCKGTNIAYSILKPDSKSYKVEKYLEYDIKEHKFVPNYKLSDDEFDKVNNMINDVLCLNWGEIVRKRKKFLSEEIEKWKSNKEKRVSQFPTAYEMCKQYYE